MHFHPKTKLARFINDFEETMIALLLGMMTLVTFANVIARYGFNSNILWALETTVFLFAWLVLLGASYCVKTQSHLGVDVIINMVSPGTRKVLGFIAVTACLAFSILLLIGSWNYWAPFAALPLTDGTLKDQAWYEVNDIPMLEFLRFIEGPMNAGESYEKIPRFIPYAALPIGLAMLTYRFLQAAWKLATGEIESVIASHEAEELVEEAASNAARED